MASLHMVKAQLTEKVSQFGRTFNKGDVVKVKILDDGRAKIVTANSIVLNPSQYNLFIPDVDYDRLLNQVAEGH